jgi:hypothetical protein
MTAQVAKPAGGDERKGAVMGELMMVNLSQHS